MKKILVFLCMSFLLFGFTSTAGALLIFEDNFDAENAGSEALNYTGFAKWTVSDGTVDLIGNGGTFDFLPGNGLYVDMDGSTGDAGKMTTSGISLSTGNYALSFDLAGNQRNAAGEQVTVQVAVGLFSGTYSLGQNDSFTTYVENFTVAADSTYFLSFEGIGGDNIGMLLDNVKIETASVPEPATMLLLGFGLLGLTGFRRKFKK